MNIDEQQRVLHSPFDVETHKKTFKNYLEVMIDEDGVVHYAVPSHHLYALNEVLKLGYSMEDIPVHYITRELCLMSRNVAVWNDCIVGVLNEKQRQTLQMLADEGLFNDRYDVLKPRKLEGMKEAIADFFTNAMDTIKEENIMTIVDSIKDRVNRVIGRIKDMYPTLENHDVVEINGVMYNINLDSVMDELNSMINIAKDVDSPYEVEMPEIYNDTNITTIGTLLGLESVFEQMEG